jgi:4-hydroxy-2-oxoheptanedioate aldolase
MRTQPCRGLTELQGGQPAYGVLQIMPSPLITEMITWSGYNFVILDCEHGLVDESSQVASLQVLTASDVFAVVRVRPGDHISVGRYLDFGADAILMPDVRSAAATAAFIAAARHGPVGTRSSAGRGVRNERYGMPGFQPKKPLLLAMIESGEAVAEVEEIARTPGLDGLVIGPFDLAADLGVKDDFSGAVYGQAFERVERACKEQRLILGSAPHPTYPVSRLLASGHRLILTTFDTTALRDGLQMRRDAMPR